MGVYFANVNFVFLTIQMNLGDSVFNRGSDRITFYSSFAFYKLFLFSDVDLEFIGLYTDRLQLTLQPL